MTAQIKRVRTKSVGNLGMTTEALFAQHGDLFLKNKGLWLIGGAAREVFVNWRRRILSKEFRSAPKLPADVDFAFIGDTAVPPELLEFDLQSAETVQEYMDTRDLAINELLLRPDWLVYSEDAETAADTQMYGMPSRYESEQFVDGVGPRTTMRSINTGNELGAVGMPPGTRSGISYVRGNFQQFLQLLKAFRKGIEDEFVRDMGYEGSAERMLLRLYGGVHDFRFGPEDGRILAYAKWVVEQEDADNNFGDIKENIGMKLEQIVRSEIRKLLEEARKMGYGPDSFEKSEDDPGDPWSIDNIEYPANDVLPTRNRKESFLADQANYDGLMDVIHNKIYLLQQERMYWKSVEEQGDPSGFDAARRVAECDAALQSAREQWTKISIRFSGGKKKGALAPVLRKGPAKGMY